MGLKRGKGNVGCQVILSLNRTNMGLKLMNGLGNWNGGLSLNRTNMGLKLVRQTMENRFGRVLIEPIWD